MIPKRPIMKFLLPFVLPVFMLTSHAGELPIQKMDVTPSPAPPFDATGGFLAPTAETLVAAGSAGGPLTLWTKPTTGENSSWKDTGLAAPKFAASAKWGDKWILVGGLLDGKPSGAVSVLELVNDQPALRPLLALPQPLVGAGAAVIGNKLHVFGGATSVEPASLSKELLVLDLTSPTGWKTGPQFPGVGRAYFAVTEQYGMLCIFGGTDENGTVLKETWAFRPKPLEGTDVAGWKRLSDMPAAIRGAAAMPSGQAQVLLLGGVAAQVGDVQGGAEPASSWFFHTLTDAWAKLDLGVEFADPVAAKSNGDVIIIGQGPEGAKAVSIRPQRAVRSLQWLDYAVIILYFLILGWIGFSFRSQESSEEFSLGNRKVKWWAAGLSMFATGASAISFMAIPALSFATNLVWLFPLIVFIPGFFVTAYLIFPMLRRLEITSTYEYLERRFNRSLRILSSLQSILFQTFARSSVVLVLPALAISAVTGINVYVSVLVMGLLTTIYTAVGGFEAVIWTEVFQAGLMLLAPIAIIYVCITGLPGGVGEFFQIGRDYGKFDFALVTWDVAVPAVWVLMLMQFVTCTVATAGDQPVIQRVFSAPLAEVRKVNAMSTACGIIIGILVNVMGLAIFAYFHAHPGKFDAAALNDQVVPIFVAQAMPIGMAGMIIAAIFAASMSTVASIMNSVATLFTEDFYMKLRKNATDRERLLSLKASSYVVGIIGTLMALALAAQDIKSMMVVWSQLGALLGGGIVGVYSLGMFTKRANGFGAICGVIGSIIITALVKAFTSLHWGTYLPVAILSCIVIGYLLSLVAPQRKDLSGLTVFTPAAK